jgi:hypothetical protein
MTTARGDDQRVYRLEDNTESALGKYYRIEEGLSAPGRRPPHHDIHFTISLTFVSLHGRGWSFWLLSDQLGWPGGHIHFTIVRTSKSDFQWHHLQRRRRQ